MREQGRIGLAGQGQPLSFPAVHNKIHELVQAGHGQHLPAVATGRGDRYPHTQLPQSPQQTGRVVENLDPAGVQHIGEPLVLVPGHPRRQVGPRGRAVGGQVTRGKKRQRTVLPGSPVHNGEVVTSRERLLPACGKHRCERRTPCPKVHRGGVRQHAVEAEQHRVQPFHRKNSDAVCCT